MSMLRIGEVSRRAGLRQSAIRYYESVGLLPAPARSSGRRRYEPDVVDRLQVIRTARELGFTLDEIRTLLYGFSPDTPPPARWRALAQAKLPEIDALLRRAGALKRLLEAGITCRCVRIDDCFLDDCSKPAHRAGALPILTAE